HRWVVGELVTEVIARIEPCAKGMGLTCRTLPELEFRLVSGVKTFIWDGNNCRQYPRFVCVENLYDVTIIRIDQFENVLARFKHFGGNLHWLVYCDDSVSFF